MSMSMQRVYRPAAPQPLPFPMSVPAPAAPLRAIVGLAIVCGLAACFYFLFTGDLFRFFRSALAAGDYQSALLRPSVLWATMALGMLALRTLLWFGYRPRPAASVRDAPPLTVVIPAYNEGAMVAKSIASVAAAHYPSGRLEILVVDDGSRDDTWHHIQEAARHHPGLVTALRHERNQGKRAALATGFRRARGDVLVTIDSDSVIEPGALLAIAGPFREPRVGAVAGKVAAYNRDGGFIARMLHVRYILSFDFMRSAQSTFGTVYCCPGALSAYRASVVRDVLDAWLNQRFLGAPCTFGEDRALTNWILARGFDTLYQSSAVVHTLVPETYMRLAKMYLRWERSYVREEIRFAWIVWRRPLVPLLLALCEKAVTNLRYPVAWTASVLFVMHAAANPLTAVRVMAVIGLGAAFYMLYYLYTEHSSRFVYGIAYAYFAFFALWWIFPYALVSVRSRAWLTR
jgi:hyaluronan synthase